MSNELSKIACNAAYGSDWIICVFVVLTGPSDSLKKYLNWKIQGYDTILSMNVQKLFMKFKKYYTPFQLLDMNSF